MRQLVVEAPAFAAELAVEELVLGGLVLGKADVGYSFVASTLPALERIYHLKGRPRSRRSVMLATPQTIHDICICDEELAVRLFEVSKRSPLSAILPVNPGSTLLGTMPAEAAKYFVEEDAVCVYLGVGDFFDYLGALTANAGILALGSSANRSGAGNIYCFHEIPEDLWKGVDLALDMGPTKYSNSERRGGTIINFVRGRERVHRRGVNSSYLEAEFADIISRGPR